MMIFIFVYIAINIITAIYAIYLARGLYLIYPLAKFSRCIDTIKLDIDTGLIGKLNRGETISSIVTENYSLYILFTKAQKYLLRGVCGYSADKIMQHMFRLSAKQADVLSFDPGSATIKIHVMSEQFLNQIKKNANTYYELAKTGIFLIVFSNGLIGITVYDEYEDSIKSLQISHIDPRETHVSLKELFYSNQIRTHNGSYMTNEEVVNCITAKWKQSYKRGFLYL